MKMRKEQLADNVILYNCDCRDVLTRKFIDVYKFDALISDPPYGIEGLIEGYGRSMLAGGSGVRVRTKDHQDKKIANDKNLHVVSEVMTMARSVLAKNAWVATFYSCRITPDFMKMMEAAGYKDYFGEWIWDKKTPGLGTQIRYQHENVAVYRIGKPAPLEDCMSLVTDIALKGNARSGTHPHEKPDRVMDHIVRAIPAKMILDPFAGTGSTGAAAVRAKRGFVGVELDPKHFEVAVRKVSEAIKQPIGFWE